MCAWQRNILWCLILTLEFPLFVAAAIKALYKQFGKWHGISSLFNLAVLVAAFAHGWWLAGSLVLA